MSRQQANAFLRQVAADPLLQRQLRTSDAVDAAELARGLGFDVTVGDLTRDKARATSWVLTDPELDLVARRQPRRQPHWWQYVWPTADYSETASRRYGGNPDEGGSMTADGVEPQDPNAQPLTDEDLEAVAGGLFSPEGGLPGEAGAPGEAGVGEAI